MTTAMITEKAKTVLLIIGIILACILLIQAFGIGIEMEGKEILEPVIPKRSSLIIEQLYQFKSAYFKF